MSEPIERSVAKPEGAKAAETVVSGSGQFTTVKVIPPHGGNPAQGQAISAGVTVAVTARTLAEIRAQTSSLHYPIANAAELLKQVTATGRAQYSVLSRLVDPATLIPQMPTSFFPLQSHEDLEKKISSSFSERTLATGEITLERRLASPILGAGTLQHPTAVAPPLGTKRPG